MQINASLLHELRMVILHGIKLFKRAEIGRKAGGGTSLLCSTCLRTHRYATNGTIRNAVTVIHGNAVCLEHLS